MKAKLSIRCMSMLARPAAARLRGRPFLRGCIDQQDIGSTQIAAVGKDASAPFYFVFTDTWRIIRDTGQHQSTANDAQSIPTSTIYTAMHLVVAA